MYQLFKNISSILDLLSRFYQDLNIESLGQVCSNLATNVLVEEVTLIKNCLINALDISSTFAIEMKACSEHLLFYKEGELLPSRVLKIMIDWCGKLDLFTHIDLSEVYQKIVLVCETLSISNEMKYETYQVEFKQILLSCHETKQQESQSNIVHQSCEIREDLSKLIQSAEKCKSEISIALKHTQYLFPKKRSSCCIL